jgi:hypothetical protein
MSASPVESGYERDRREGFGVDEATRNPPARAGMSGAFDCEGKRSPTWWSSRWTTDGLRHPIAEHALRRIPVAGAAEAHTWVFEHASKSRAFLEGLGFERTGARRPDPSFADKVLERVKHSRAVGRGPAAPLASCFRAETVPPLVL